MLVTSRSCFSSCSLYHRLARAKDAEWIYNHYRANNKLYIYIFNIYIYIYLYIYIYIYVCIRLAFPCGPGRGVGTGGFSPSLRRRSARRGRTGASAARSPAASRRGARRFDFLGPGRRMGPWVWRPDSSSGEECFFFFFFGSTWTAGVFGKDGAIVGNGLFKREAIEAIAGGRGSKNRNSRMGCMESWQVETWTNTCGLPLLFNC